MLQRGRPSHSEVRILVDCTGYEASDIPSVAKHVGKGGGEGRGSLHRREGNLAYAAFHCEPKNAPDLIHGHCPACCTKLADSETHTNRYPN